MDELGRGWFFARVARRSSRPIVLLMLMVMVAGLGVTAATAGPNGSSILNAPLADADDVAAPTGSTANAGEGDASFADAFFIARRVNARGERRIEWLGSIVIWGLLLMSAVSLSLIGQLSIANQRASILPDELADQLDTQLRDGAYRKAINTSKGDRSLFGALMHTTLLQAAHGHAAMLNALVQTADELAAQRIRRIEILNVLGQVSPMIGLFGTVYGMILAFQSIVAAGGSADPVRLAGGISTALTTTFWGLVVAIPALAAYALLRARIEGLTAEAAMRGETLLARFRPADAAADSAADQGKTA